jgi:hypothetical protein
MLVTSCATKNPGSLDPATATFTRLRWGPSGSAPLYYASASVFCTGRLQTRRLRSGTIILKETISLSDSTFSFFFSLIIYDTLAVTTKGARMYIFGSLDIYMYPRRCLTYVFVGSINAIQQTIIPLTYSLLQRPVNQRCSCQI